MRSRCGVLGTCGLLVLALAVPSGSARGQPADAEPAELEAVGPMLPPLEAELAGVPRPRFSLLPAAVSVVPGVLLHGLGPLVAGESSTGARLFLLQGAGLGLLAAGGVPIALSGASRRVIGPLYGVAAVGLGLFSISGLANLYGVVGPAFEPGVAAPRLPPLELEVGYQHVADTAFRYRHFAAVGVVARLRRLRLEAGARMSPDDGNLRARVGGAWRLLGASEAARGKADGSALDVEAAALVHRFPTEGFTLGGGEVFLRGRYDMARVGARLAGSFAEVGLGLALQGYGYTAPVADDSLHEQLLVTFGYGVYLGRGGPFRGEALLYYDHRKDDFPGGFKGGSGVPGHLGLRGRALLGERWGLSAEVQVGSAWVGRLSLVYALGGES